MSFVISTFVIDGLDADCNPHYIFDALYTADIATVSRVTLLPYQEWSPFMQTLLEFTRAYVEIHEWHDTEAAFNLISALKKGDIVPFTQLGAANVWSIYYDLDSAVVTRYAQFKKETTVFYLASDDDTFYDDKESGESYRTAADPVFPVVGAFQHLELIY
jgi:hypothetical protein